MTKWLWEGGFSIRMFTDEKLRSEEVEAAHEPGLRDSACAVSPARSFVCSRTVLSVGSSLSSDAGRGCVGRFDERSQGVVEVPDPAWGGQGRRPPGPELGHVCWAEGTACAKAQRRDLGVAGSRSRELA